MAPVPSRLLALAALLPANSILAAADYTTVIGAGSDWGTWSGWGTSLAWWAALWGDRDDLADIFFTTNDTPLGGEGGQDLPGLGFNIMRYNAGASSWNSYLGESMVVSPNMYPTRQVEGYWLDWNSTDPTSASWDWSVDETQRNMMTKGVARGVNHVELFSNSPMWWMTYNHNPSGNGANDNLQSWNYRNHAKYLAEIARYSHENWGVTFETVEPFNEPFADWWIADGTQEGCHFDVATQATVLPLLREELDAVGLGDTLIAASDESTYDWGTSTFRNLGDTARGYIDRVNVHGYQGSGGRRDILYDEVRASGQVLWNSEYGENDATGERLIRNIMLDFRWLHPTAWQYWQVLDHQGWGLIDASWEEATIADPSQKYFCLAQFSRHIREGMRILDAEPNIIPAYDAENRKLVIVAVNWDEPQNLEFDLSEFAVMGVDGASVGRWATQVGSGDQYVSYDDTTISGGLVSAFFETGNIMTFEINDVEE